MRIAVGSDHAGVELKDGIKEYLGSEGYEVIDVGVSRDEGSVDYPDTGKKVAAGVSEGEFERGVLVCGTGIGMSIVANKYRGVRAALVYNEFSSEHAARHNDANILVLPGRVISTHYGVRLVEIWLKTGFEGGRHRRRLEKIEQIEKENFR